RRRRPSPRGGPGPAVPRLFARARRSDRGRGAGGRPAMMGTDASRRSLIFVREIRTPDEGIAAQQGLRQATNLLGLEGYEQTRLNTAAAELIREAGLPSGPLALDLRIVVDGAGRAGSLELSLGLPRPTALRLRQSLTQGGSSNGSNDGADSPSGIV